MPWGTPGQVPAELVLRAGQTLETARLRLRPVEHEDAAALAAIYGDPATMRFVSTGATLGEDETALSVAVAVQRYSEDGFGLLAVERLEDSRVIGTAGLSVWSTDRWVRTSWRRTHGQAEIELGAVLGRPYWGQGYGTEALAVIRDLAMDGLCIPRLISLFHPDNRAAIGCFERLGLRYERTITVQGRTTLLYAIERSATDGSPAGS